MRYGFHNSLPEYAWTLAVRDVRRRWTRVAIALQQYRQKQGQWPERLSDLAEIGLSPTDIEIRAGHPMGYRVADGIAQLWLPRLDRWDHMHQQLGDVPRTGDLTTDYRLDDRLLQLK